VKINARETVTIYRLGPGIAFPDPEEAEPDGLLAVGGNLSPERLLAAYAHGIFPWYTKPPILWFSPNPRMLLVPRDLHVPRRLERTLRQQYFEITCDVAFADVMRACAETPRRREKGTWISTAMIEAYCELHRLGYAHSIEAWRGGKLAGGLYGVALGHAFFAESMFHRQRDASKVALVNLVRQLSEWEFEFFDCQIYSEHVARFGARPWPRRRFLAQLARALRAATRRGRWELTSIRESSDASVEERSGMVGSPRRVV